MVNSTHFGVEEIDVDRVRNSNAAPYNDLLPQSREKVCEGYAAFVYESSLLHTFYIWKAFFND